MSGVKSKSIRLISAPAEKNRPSPVRTVNIVRGFWSSSRNAVTISASIVSFHAFSTLGLFNCWGKHGGYGYTGYWGECGADLDDADLVVDVDHDVGIRG